LSLAFHSKPAHGSQTVLRILSFLPGGGVVLPWVTCAPLRQGFGFVTALILKAIHFQLKRMNKSWSQHGLNLPHLLLFRSYRHYLTSQIDQMHL
jgi:hypothetical protein